MDSIETNKDAIDQELKCITATPVVVPKDHKDDVSYLIMMLEKGVPIYNDGPPKNKTSDSKCSLLILGCIILKYNMM